MLWRRPKIRSHADVPDSRSTLLNLLASREFETTDLACKYMIRTGRWSGVRAGANGKVQSNEVPIQCCGWGAVHVARFYSSHSGFAHPVRNCRHRGADAQPDGAGAYACASRA